MPPSGKGIVALAGPTIDLKQVLHGVSDYDPDDWALCKLATGDESGWFGLTIGSLKHGLKSMTTARGTAEVVDFSEALLGSSLHSQLYRVVSPVMARPMRGKMAGILDEHAARMKLLVALQDDQKIDLELEVQDTIQLIDDLWLDLDRKKASVTWGLPRQPASWSLGDRWRRRVPYIEIGSAGTDGPDFFIGDPKTGVNAVGRIVTDKVLRRAEPVYPISRYDELKRMPLVPRPAFRLPCEPHGLVDYSAPPPSQPVSSPPAGEGGGGGPGEPQPVGAEPTGAEQELTVFPHFQAEPRHVVQRKPLRVTITLEFAPAEDTKGEVIMPPGVHVLDVHVLLQESSAWGKLEFDSEKGTTRPATVSLVAPPVPAEGYLVHDRWFVPVVANFYRQGVWCGEGRYQIEVLARRSVAPSEDDEMPALAEGPWSAVLRLVPGSVPPDLLVRIQWIGSDEYKFSLISPHLNLEHIGDDKTAIGSDAYRFVKAHLNQIAGNQLDADQIKTVRDRLRAIYDSTPDAFKNGYWKLWHAARVQEESEAGGLGPRLSTIQFISDEPYIPWDLMLTRPEQPDEPEQVLSILHAVGRWSPQRYCHLRSKLAVRKMAVFAFDYAGDQAAPALPWAAEEEKFLSADPYFARAGGLTKEAVTRFLREGGAQAVHFSCHGVMDVQRPSEATLRLSDYPNFTTALVDDAAVRAGLGQDHPLVFLNACQVGGQGNTIAIVTGWPQAFLNIGATACVAPLWNVVDSTAKTVAEEFYRLVFQERLPLGEALRRIKGQWESKKSLTYLSYALYGDPAATVTWQREPRPL